MSELRLVTTDTRASPQELALEEGALVTLGRDEACDVRLDARRASARHARLLRQGATVLVEDLGAPTGIRVNGEPVPRAELSPGDQLEVGGVVFELAGATEAGEATASRLLGALAGLLLLHRDRKNEVERIPFRFEDK